MHICIYIDGHTYMCALSQAVLVVQSPRIAICRGGSAPFHSSRGSPNNVLYSHIYTCVCIYKYMYI